MIDDREDDYMYIWDISVLDFDSAQKGWYVTDIGSILFNLNYELYPGSVIDLDQRAYQGLFYQFKRWFIDAYEKQYGKPVDEDELEQGCRWRKDFMYKWSKDNERWTPPGQQREWMSKYINFYESGNMPNC